MNKKEFIDFISKQGFKFDMMNGSYSNDIFIIWFLYNCFSLEIRDLEFRSFGCKVLIKMESYDSYKMIYKYTRKLKLNKILNS